MHFCIVGTSRSGSTLLRNLLHEHGQLAVFNESHWIPKMYEFFGAGVARSKDLVSIVRDTEWDDGQCVLEQNLRLCGRDPAEVWEELHSFCAETPNTTIRDFHTFLAEFSFPQKDFQYWGDKTPDYGYYMSQLAAIWPRCKFIHIVRDPLDTALSMSRHSGVSLQLSAGQHNWVSLSYRQAYKNVTPAKHELQDYYSSCLERLCRIRTESKLLKDGHYREVTYESLVADPSAVLSELCDYLEIDNDSRWREQVVSQVRKPRCNSTKADLPAIPISESARLGEPVTVIDKTPDNFKTFCDACVSAEKVISYLLEIPGLSDLYPAVDQKFIDAAQHCFAQNPEASPEYRCMEGETWRRLGLKLKALAPLKESFTWQPSPHRANLLAWNYWDLGLFAKIEPLARYVLANNPQDNAARRLLLISLVEREEYMAAEQALGEWESLGLKDQLYFEMQVKLQLGREEFAEARVAARLGYTKFKSLFFLNAFINASARLGFFRSALSGSKLALRMSREAYIIRRHANLLKECRRWRQALRYYIRVFERDDQSAPVLRSIVVCLQKSGISPHEVATSEFLKKNPAIELEVRARRALEEGDLVDCIDFAQELYRYSPSSGALNLALESALRLGREDLIREFIDELKDSGLFDEESARYEIQYIAKRDVKAALQRLQEIVEDFGINAGLVHQKAHLLNCLSRYSEALSVVEEQRFNFDLSALLVHQNIFCGNFDAAKTLIEADLQKLSLRQSSLSTWYRAHSGNLDEATAHWNRRNQPYPNERVLLRPESRTDADCDLSVPLVTVIRNELARLPEFLRYYREIGVTGFVFVVNNSDDGSLEYLQRQEDVLLYSTEQSYKAFRFGIDWINYVIDLLGLNRWVIYADVDELLVLPGIEEKKLPRLLSELDEEGTDCVTAVMLDMHGENICSGEHYQAGDSFVAQLPYFHNDIDQLPSVEPPFVQHYGGLRRHLFWPVGERGNILTKTPIVRAGKIYFNLSSHEVSPGKVSSMSGALLHFKFLGDAQADIEKEVERLEHANIIDEYQRYADGIRALGEKSILNACSVRYTGSGQLETLGLIKGLDRAAVTLD